MHTVEGRGCILEDGWEQPKKASWRLWLDES